MNNNREFRTVRGYELLKRKQKKLTPSMEDYLEMIYRSCATEGYVRINHLTEKLNVQPSSVSRVVKKLAELGYLDYEKYGIIRLTRSGTLFGAFLLKRHQTIESFLQNLGVTDNVLVETELIEHYFSMDTIEKIETFNAFIAANPDVSERLRQFQTTAAQK
jgi:DtxR family Mn-dependent transcriptional regulator